MELYSTHPRIVQLAAELMPLIEDPHDLPTEGDHDKLMSLREKVHNLADEGGVKLDEDANADRLRLYVAATTVALRQKNFFLANGSRWAE